MEGIDRTVVFHARNGHEILTKEDAKREALAMWRWLRDHPTRDKEDYLGTIGLSFRDWHCRCALCEYKHYSVGYSGSCLSIGCPLSHGENYGCEKLKGTLNSAILPYVRWKRGGKTVKIVAAREIVALIKAW